MSNTPNRKSHRKIRKDLKKPIRGFFYIRCEACGREKGFYTREYLEFHECTCGQRNDVLSARLAYVQCKCGYERRYYTNIRDDHFEQICHNCGMPIAMELSYRDGVYYSLVDEE